MALLDDVPLDKPDELPPDGGFHGGDPRSSRLPPPYR